MSSSVASHAASPAPDNRALFFPLLLAATAVTFILFPVTAHIFPAEASLAQLTAAITFVGSGGHVAASFFFYSDTEMRERLLLPQRNRFIIVPVTFVLGSALFFGLSGPVAVAWGATAYWVWQTHHYTRQNHGILAFASRAAGVPISSLERTAITLTGIAAVLGMVTFVTPTTETGLLEWGWYIHTVALGVFVAGWVLYGVSLFQRNPADCGQRSLVLLMLMLFFMPLFFFADALSAVATYAIAHGLQYLVFMSFVVSRPRRTVGLALLGGFVAAGGGLLFFLRTQHGTQGLMSEAFFGAYLGFVMWHFLLDAGVWRLSEPFQRDYMAERFDFLR
jgi:hypothetical protein